MLPIGPTGFFGYKNLLWVRIAFGAYQKTKPRITIALNLDDLSAVANTMVKLSDMRCGLEDYCTGPSINFSLTRGKLKVFIYKVKLYIIR